MLEIKNVHKSFGNNEILKGVDIKVEKGDIIVILGPSGSGKTTLLRCINFLERADRGTIDFDDIHTEFKTAAKHQINDIRRRTSFVFQNYNLFANKTALENVTEGLIIARKVPKQEALSRAKQALDK
ncbi:MAG: ATP-binding cassette domain-containing protein, partial [Lachnospiraceae bacterium]|nr:ATP-binding cassette domain-containing protein [Lachnospiraceae bacterium]